MYTKGISISRDQPRRTPRRKLRNDRSVRPDRKVKYHLISRLVSRTARDHALYSYSEHLTSLDVPLYIVHTTSCSSERASRCCPKYLGPSGPPTRLEEHGAPLVACPRPSRDGYVPLTTQPPVSVADSSADMSQNGRLVLAPEVEHALEKGAPVIALESTIITHGKSSFTPLPLPNHCAQRTGERHR